MDGALCEGAPPLDPALSPPARRLLELDEASGGIGGVLLGRVTHERLGAGQPPGRVQRYVFSRSAGRPLGPECRWLSGSAVEHVTRLKAEPGSDLWLLGGARLASSLVGAGLVDQVVVRREPSVQGKGTPLLALHPELAESAPDRYTAEGDEDWFLYRLGRAAERGRSVD